MRDTNIETTGRGIWFTLHLRASKAVTRPMRRKVRVYMEFLAVSLPCPVCREHLQDYLDRSRHLWRQMRDAESLLYYTWYLHSLVNQKKGKPDLPFEVVREFYARATEEASCEDFCAPE